MKRSMMVIAPTGYGEYYIVLAETTQEALDKLKGHMLSHLSCYEDDYPRWKDATLSTMPRGYSIDIVDGDVIEAECS